MTNLQFQGSLDVSSYKTLSDRDHVLLRPDMYIGPVDRIPRREFCFSPTEMTITEKDVQHAEGQGQTFIEVIGNAADNIQRSRDYGIDPGIIETMITADWVVVKNYGISIPIERNSDSLWIPYTIFGMFRSGSNYDDSKVRLWIGKNGVGAKATCTYSKIFKVECTDPSRGLKYVQTWYDNMGSYSEPEITSYSGKGYTQISYSLDFPRFGVTSFDQEALEIYGAHCVGVSYTCNVPVIFNGKTIHVKNIIEYANMFFKINKSSAITYIDPKGAYEICLVDTPDTSICKSFVNGITTSKGGVHVDAAYKTMVDSIKEYLGNAIKGITITKRDIVNHVSMFLACRLPNPQFKSQSKEDLARPKPNIIIPEKNMKNVKKWQLIERLYMEIQRKQMNKLKQTDGKHRRKNRSDKLQDANLAGKKGSENTTLILTEGDSASGYMVKWISNVPNHRGRDYFGIQPLQGKILNVINADFLQILENTSIKNIKAALGLEEEMNYIDDANYARLQYGYCLIAADPDKDGIHILGLVLLFFMARFPSLVQRGFLKFLRIPILRVSKGGEYNQFYTYYSYLKWRSTTPNPDTWHHEYFKGLGSSEDHHINVDFANPKIVTFKIDPEAGEKIVLAFHKTKADQRKEWISNYVTREVLDVESFTDYPITHFINHEFIEYSIENIIRSTPEAVDGFKESQRKAFYAALKKLRGKKKNTKTKVAQIASYAAEITCYKHGEGCLADTIITMTYDFPGSNNMNYFVPRGQFGTKNQGGKDAAQPRYVSISLPDWVKYIYRPEDKCIEKLIVDEGEEQECENFYPVLPMHVINGVNGIGTGWSSNIPCHNPLDIAFWLQQRILQSIQSDHGHNLPLIRPWYRGFIGNITPVKDGFTTEGKMHIQPNGSVVITELPVGKWTLDYWKWLEELEDEGIIADIKNNSDANDVLITIGKYLDGNPTPKKLKLINKHSYKNMTVLYRTENRGILPKKYSSINDLLDDFYKIRLIKYEERKKIHLKEISDDIYNLSERARFILSVIGGQIVFQNRPEADVYNDMDTLKLDRIWLDKVKSREYTQERVALLNVQIDKKKKEYEELNGIYPEQVWYKEIEEFVQYYCRTNKMTRSTFDSCNPAVILTIGK